MRVLTLGGIGALAHAMLQGHGMALREMAAKHGIDVLIEPEPRQGQPLIIEDTPRLSPVQEFERDNAADLAYGRIAMAAAEAKRARKNARRLSPTPAPKEDQ